mmetsp:Transcript_19811/g.42612  ORF Transcript_19811/g.42612 Transcript_19811/m.42612 type:complete len:203 (-) Transcript_19811:175-783(-)
MVVPALLVVPSSRHLGRNSLQKKPMETITTMVTTLAAPVGMKHFSYRRATQPIHQSQQSNLARRSNLKIWGQSSSTRMVLRDVLTTGITCQSMSRRWHGGGSQRGIMRGGQLCWRKLRGERWRRKRRRVDFDTIVLGLALGVSYRFRIGLEEFFNGDVEYRECLNKNMELLIRFRMICSEARWRSVLCHLSCEIWDKVAFIG